MEFLTNLDLERFTQFIYVWGAMGIISALFIHILKVMPMSGREENSLLTILGTMDKKLGWIIMETPILLTVIYFYAIGTNPVNVSAIIVGVFILHYINRAMIYPHRIKAQGKTIPISMVLTTLTFYTINGYLIGHYFGSLRSYPIEWLADPRFIIGIVMFFSGLLINVHSDNILIKLRGPGETGYKIPKGGFFKYVSCPNYFGEIVEWTGFALMSWSLPGTIYTLWVVLALFFQALLAHKWYIDKFGDDYPQDRKAIFPYIL